MHTEDFIDLTAGLRELGGQRVWSLMISLFGDLARETGQTIDGPVLSAIMAEMQVRPEAARVALHRLRNDGWIASEKSGRISSHSLTAKGRAESIAASGRIYADPTLDRGDWVVIITEDVTDLTEQGFTPVAPRVHVAPADLPVPQGALVLPGGTAPKWLYDQVAPSAQMPGYGNLLTELRALDQNLPPAAALDAIHISVLRCLIVHNWRRLVLKHPRLPGALVDPDSAAHRCHLAVADLLARYPRPAMPEIAQSCAAA